MPTVALDREDRLARLRTLVQHCNLYADPVVADVQKALRTAIRCEELEGELEALQAAGMRLVPFLPDMEPVGAAAFSEHLQASIAFRKLLGVHNG